MKSMSVSDPKLQAIFNALGDERRYQIIQLLNSKDELCVSEVAQKVGISVAGVSQHMQVLERAGLVNPKRQGQKMCYQLNDEAVSVKQVIKLVEQYV